MNRRTVLKRIGATVSATAVGGCLADGNAGRPGTETTGEDTPEPGTTGGTETTTTQGAIRVAKATAGGLTPEPRAQVIEVTPDGQLRFVLDCNADDGVQQAATEPLGDEEYAAFASAVREADVFDLKDDYECREECPTDLPWNTLRFTIDGREKSITIRPGAELPTELTRILEHLTEFEKRFSEYDCTAPDGAPTDQTVSVTVRRTVANVPEDRTRERTFTVTADGRLRHRLNCNVYDDEVEHAITGDLPAEEYARFERAVLWADVFSLPGRIECDDCPGGVPGTTYVFRVDGREKRIHAPANAALPHRLERVRELLDRYRERIDRPECDWTSDEPPTSKSASVTLSIGPGGWNRVPTVTLSVADGQVRMEKDCIPGDPDGAWNASAELTDAEREAFERAVRTTDVSSLPESSGPVATDLPDVTLTVVVDGHSEEIDLTGTAHRGGLWENWPDELAAIGQRLDAYRKRLDPPECERTA